MVCLGSFFLPEPVNFMLQSGPVYSIKSNCFFTSVKNVLITKSVAVRNYDSAIVKFKFKMKNLAEISNILRVKYKFTIVN
jgi:hypothetical protein